MRSTSISRPASGTRMRAPCDGIEESRSKIQPPSVLNSPSSSSAPTASFTSPIVDSPGTRQRPSPRRRISTMSSGGSYSS